MNWYPLLIWLLAWPVAGEIQSYLYVKRRDLMGCAPDSDAAWVVGSLVRLSVYVFIARALWPH